MKNSIKKLPDDGLYLIYQDVINRIGSHSIGGSPDQNYIKKQEEILGMVKDELNSRGKGK